jgi:hypothetical protein
LLATLEWDNYFFTILALDYDLFIYYYADDYPLNKSIDTLITFFWDFLLWVWWFDDLFFGDAFPLLTIGYYYNYWICFLVDAAFD